jgi:carbon-monoxide dehydrogenase small subunit
MIMTVEHLLQENPCPTPDELVNAISGNLCRCTGYQQILEAAQSVVDAKRISG